ncbi:hypothetical protein QBC39DRAFT_353097 [Podospora conica]|nr:hypothetical protein QBC39DRAFT_353097 [Schizothecium conicum]
MPSTFRKKRRGRPPGRPNRVCEANYADNPLVQTWNRAKAEHPMVVVPIAVREALTEALLVHETQRAIFRQPSREIIHFVQGWISARHIASQRPSYVNGLLIHSRGDDAPVSCASCADRRAKGSLGPFPACRVLAGQYHNSCSNCKWFDNTSACSLYTGPEPNRKRKKAGDGEAVQAQGQGEGVASEESYLPPHGGVDEAFMGHHHVQATGSAIDPALQLQVGSAGMHQTGAMHQMAEAPMHQTTEAHFAIHGDDHDIGLLEHA